jgi:hypothetical protein
LVSGGDGGRELGRRRKMEEIGPKNGGTLLLEISWENGGTPLLEISRKRKAGDRRKMEEIGRKMGARKSEIRGAQRSAGSERGARSWTPVVGTPLQLTGRGRWSWAPVVGTGRGRRSWALVVDAGRGHASAGKARAHQKS